MRLQFTLLISVPLWLSATSFAVADEEVQVVYPKQDRQVAAALASPAQPTYFGDMREVLQKIAEEKQIDIVIDEVPINEAAVDLDDVIDYDIEDIDPRRAARDDWDLAQGLSLATFLEILFERQALTYVVDDGVLKVTTVEASERKKLVRSYEVPSLMDSVAIKDLADAVSRIASNLERRAPVSRGNANRQPESSINSASTMVVVPFKTSLVVVGNPNDHERVLKAIAMLQQIETD